MSDRKALQQAFSEPRSWDYEEATFLGSMRFSSRMGLFVLFGLIALGLAGGAYFHADRTLGAATDDLARANRMANLAATVEKKAWQLRNNEKYFLLGKGSQYVASHEAGAATLSAALNTLYELPETEPVGKQITTINEGLALYTEEVLALVKAEQKSLGRLDEIFAYMVPSLIGLSDFAKGQVAAAAKRQAWARTFVRLLLPGALAALLLFVVLFGHVLMRGFTAPVRAVAEATRKLSHGEEDVVIPVLGNRDELGDLVHALTELKAKLTESAQLHDELEAARGELNDGKATLAEAEWLRKDKEDALAEAEKLRKELETTRREAENGEAASIEAALLRIDLEATKAELEKSEADNREAASIEAGAPFPQAEAGEAAEPASRTHAGTISTLSLKVTRASQDASTAAYEAERTGALIKGLTSAADKIGDVENLLVAIGEQTDYQADRPEPKEDRGEDKADNLVLLTSEYRSALEMADKGGDAVGRRFDSIRATASQVTWAIKDIADTINGVKEIAVEIASVSSAEALRITNELLKQSEHLRGMLDNLVGSIDGKPQDQPASEPEPPEAEFKPPSQA